jgi:hypothetical protein
VKEEQEEFHYEYLIKVVLVPNISSRKQKSNDMRPNASMGPNSSMEPNSSEFQNFKISQNPQTAILKAVSSFNGNFGNDT